MNSGKAGTGQGKISGHLFRLFLRRLGLENACPVPAGFDDTG